MCPPPSDAEDVRRRRRRLPTRRTLLRTGAVIAGGAVALTAAGAAAYYTTRYPASARHSGLLALSGATVLSGSDLRQEPEAVVLVRDGRIIQVGTGIDVPAEAEVWELPGATVLPGLIDMHTHLAFPVVEPSEEFSSVDVPGHLWDAVRYAPETRRALLSHGVTAVRSLGDELDWVLDLRDAVAEGTLEGPRVFCAGPVLTTPGGHPLSTHNAGAESTRLPGTAREAETIVGELLDGERPVDVIKVIQERGLADHPLPPHDPAVLEAVVASAHERGVPVTGHCGTLTDLAEVVDAGFDGVEHLTMRDPAATSRRLTRTAGTAWPEGTLERMLDGGVTLDPTLVVEWAGRAAESPEGAEARDRVRARLLEAHEAGVPVVAGSDAAIPGMRFGLGLVQEIEALGAAGLPRRDALQAATSGAATALGTAEIGVIEPGRAADLLVVAGDPLADLSALHQVTAVFRDGRMVAGDLEPAGAR